MSDPKTCETCDWWCYGTWPANTCEKWEKTVYEIDVPDDLIMRLAGMPTSEDMEALRGEIERLETDGT